jgi:gamma-glutamyl phosphate reductase
VHRAEQRRQDPRRQHGDDGRDAGLQENNAAVETYTQCLKAEQDAKIAAGGADMKDEDKVKISKDYVDRQNVEVEKLQKLADHFNLEVRNYKAKHAADAAASPPPPPK